MQQEERHPLNRWTIKSKDIKYDNPWIRIVENQVINPAGNDGIYGVVHFKTLAIAVIPLDEDYNSWIVGQFRFPLHTYEWEVVEGGCPFNEDPIDCARRELIEEAGIEAREFKLVQHMQLSNSSTDELSYTFVARDLKMVEQEPEETEVLQIRKLPFSEIFRMAYEGEIKDGLSVASIYKVQMMIERGEL